MKSMSNSIMVSSTTPSRSSKVSCMLSENPTTKMEEYNIAMKKLMRNPYEYHYDLGMNYTLITDKLIVGSQPQKPEDIDHLKMEEDVAYILNLQQDRDIEYWEIDLKSIIKRCRDLEIRHMRRPINTCNGMRCGETFVGPNSPNKPSIWTENWTTQFTKYGENIKTRSPEDIAFHVALFIARKYGSFVNYYMYHGGTNFGRTASDYIPTSYYDLAPLDEYGLIRQPKWGHLKELHAAIKLCSETLLTGSLTTSSIGEQQEAYVFQGQPGQCAAFLVNNDGRNDVQVMFQNSSYELPRKSISILPDCKTVAFNTAKVKRINFAEGKI